MLDDRLTEISKAIEQQHFNDARNMLCLLAKDHQITVEMQELAEQIVGMTPKYHSLMPEAGLPDDPKEQAQFLHDHYAIGEAIFYKLPELHVIDQVLFSGFPDNNGNCYVVLADLRKEIYKPPRYSGSYDWYPPQFSYDKGVLQISQSSKYSGSEGKSWEDITWAIYRIKGHFFYKKRMRQYSSKD